MVLHIRRLPILVLWLAGWFFLSALVAVYSQKSNDSSSSSCSASETIPTVVLSNGVEMPQLALGTAVFAANDGKDPSNPRHAGFLPEQVYRPVQLALEAGIRHIDTAFIYRSHTAISRVLANWFISGKLQKRSDVFITTKVFHPVVSLATKNTVLDLDNMTSEQVVVAVEHDFEQSLIELSVGYVDLALLHWSSSFEIRDENHKDTEEKEAAARQRRLAAWRVLESYYERGWAKAIGVSNFSDEHLRQLQEDGATIQPMVNQIETSVYLRHENIINYCQEHNIVVESYSPLGRGVKNIHKDPVVLEIAQKHNKTPGQVALRFLVQQGFAVTFYSSSAERMESNMNIFSFALDDTDMEKLYALNSPQGTWGLPSPYDLY